MDDQPLREFLAEADERVEVLFADIERLRRVHAAADGRARRELVARIFRHVHTLKGSAASLLQLAPFNQLAHEFENLLDAIRSGRAPLTAASVDACEDATGALSHILDSVAHGDAAPELPPAVFKQLRHQQQAGAPPGHVAEETNQSARSGIVAALPAEIARALSGVEQRHLSESVREGARVMLLAAAFGLAKLDEDFTRFTGALGERGEIISTFPGDPAPTPDGISFLILYTTNCQPTELESSLAPFGAKIAWTGDEPETADAGAKTTTNKVAPVFDGDELSNVKSGEPGVAAGAAASSPIFVRVPLRELDELVTATHELFTDTLALLEQTPAFESPVRAGAATAAHAEGRGKLLRENFGALEERVMALRMQPLMPVLERAARGARMAARAAGKEIELEVVGGGVSVDRSLAEQIGGPLLHLLRNAIDHGIETPEERRAAGKPVGGRVRLEVKAEGSRVLVRVADDGRGVDAERVARVAVAHGLVEAGAPLTDEDALRLIFRPGFSTAESVSVMSGRGVGLDVVEHALEHAGGELRVRTRRGEGTTFELRLPLALALVSVVVVRAGSYAYAVDASHVVEIGCLKATDILAGEAKFRSAHWRGRTLPLVSLCALLGQAQTVDVREEIPVIIARRERPNETDGWPDTHQPEEFIIAVDEIDGERKALVRSLGRHATRWRGISGAFAGRDGTVALLLDLPGLLERMAIAEDERG